MNYDELWRRLTQVLDEGEAKAIARMVYEVRYGLTFTDLCLGKDRQLSADCQTELEEIARRLLKQEPVQYVLGVADFCGRQFHVAPGVLIPRPETEELCRWIISDLGCKRPEINDYSILDIGTGSGCIAITLAAELLEAEVVAWDISADALFIAQENAIRLDVNILFEQVDILKPQTSNIQSPFDLIVSNPPYILNKERACMEANVLDYEPHLALFVPDDDPLLFYRAIAEYATVALKPGGWLYFEINPLCATALQDLFRSMKFSLIEIKSDAYGKQRMLRAQR
jgi:release factor glutamine methyltransferase